MQQNTTHRNTCAGAICADGITDEELDTLPWYPGEPACRKRPFTTWQKRQTKINRLVEKGLFKFTDFYWTAKMLETRHIIRKTSKGLDPDIPVGESRVIRS